MLGEMGGGGQTNRACADDRNWKLFSHHYILSYNTL
jgi:hypothetical protein